MGHLLTLITAPTVARLVSHQPHQLPRLQPLSPPPSVTILIFRAPTITTLTLAILLASTRTPTSIHPGDPTAARSSTVSPWLLLTAPLPPAGTSQSTPHCLDLRRPEAARSHQGLIQIDALLTKEVRSRRWRSVCVCVEASRLKCDHLNLRQTKEKVPADFIQSYIVATKKTKNNTLVQTFYTKRNCVVGEPDSSMRTYRLRLHPVHPSFQLKIACVCAHLR